MWGTTKGRSSIFGRQRRRFNQNLCAYRLAAIITTHTPAHLIKPLLSTLICFKLLLPLLRPLRPRPSLARVLTRTSALTRHSHAHTEHMFNSTRAHTHETNVRRPTSRSSPSLSTNLHACVTQPLMRAHAHLPLAATRLSHPRPAVAWLLPIPTLTHTCGSAYERVRTHAHTRDTLS